MSGIFGSEPQGTAAARAALAMLDLDPAQVRQTKRELVLPDPVAGLNALLLVCSYEARAGDTTARLDALEEEQVTWQAFAVEPYGSAAIRLVRGLSGQTATGDLADLNILGRDVDVSAAALMRLFAALGRQRPADEVRRDLVRARDYHLAHLQMATDGLL